jgi:multiple sugar transport system permease protein
MSASRDTAVRGNLAARLEEFRDSIRRDHLLWVVIALGPVFALFCIIRVYPILETIRLSFYRYHPTQRNRPFIGLDNYWRLLEDEAFHTALINTLQFCVMAVVITLLLAFAVAVLLRSIEKVAPIYELLLYIPVVTPWVPASVIWKWIFDPIHGILNYGLSFLGIPKLAWLQDEHVILYAIVLVSVWKMLGYFVVVYGVGLRNIPDELLEASELDGATPWQRLIYVVIPDDEADHPVHGDHRDHHLLQLCSRRSTCLPPRRRARRPMTSRSSSARSTRTPSCSIAWAMRGAVRRAAAVRADAVFIQFTLFRDKKAR